MNQVEQQIECHTCQWNKLCIEPPSMTKEEVDAKMEESKPKRSDSPDEPEKSVMGGLMAALFFGGKDTECHCCPVFVAKLREGPELTQKIREMMRSI